MAEQDIQQSVEQQQSAEQQQNLENLEVENQESNSSDSNNLDKISSLEAELAETKDKLLRLAADFDNFKKRTIKEKTEIINFANEDLIKGLLPVLDDFERTMKVLHDSDNLEAIRQGMELVSKNFFHQLNKKGVEMIDAMGQNFDSDLHEAIGTIPADSPEKRDKIIDVIEQGYKLNGKVIRFSKVIIGE